MTLPSGSLRTNRGALSGRHYASILHMMVSALDSVLERERSLSSDCLERSWFGRTRRDALLHLLAHFIVSRISRCAAKPTAALFKR